MLSISVEDTGVTLVGILIQGESAYEDNMFRNWSLLLLSILFLYKWVV